MAPSAKREKRNADTSSEALPSTISSETRRPATGPIAKPWPLNPVASTKPRGRRHLAQHGQQIGRGVDVPGPAPRDAEMPHRRQEARRARPGSVPTLSGLGTGSMPRSQTSGCRRAGDPGRAARRLRPQRPPHVEAEHRLVLPEARQEEPDLAQGIERDVVIEGAARGDIEAAVAPLAEGHARRPHGAGRHGRRRRRARDRPAHPPLRQGEAEGAREPRRPRARRAHHPRGADLAALGRDARSPRRRGWSTPSTAHPRWMLAPVGDGGAREGVGGLLGIGVAVARRVEAPGPPAGEPGNDGRRSAGAEQMRLSRPNSRATGSHCLEERHALVIRRRAPGCRPAPTRCPRPARPRARCQKRFDSIMRGSSLGSLPAGARSPSSSATARRAPAPAPRRPRAAPSGQEIGGRATDDSRPDDDDVCVPLHKARP